MLMQHITCFEQAKGPIEPNFLLNEGSTPRSPFSQPSASMGRKIPPNGSQGPKKLSGLGPTWSRNILGKTKKSMSPLALGGFGPKTWVWESWGS